MVHFSDSPYRSAPHSRVTKADTPRFVVTHDRCIFDTILIILYCHLVTCFPFYVLVLLTFFGYQTLLVSKDSSA